MKIQSTDLNEALNKIYKILNQGDSRYDDAGGEYTLATFLTKKAVVIEEKEIPPINKPEEKELRNIVGRQKQEKYIAKILLNNYGFKDNELFFERRFNYSRPDIFAESDKKIVLVECCSCRINKIIEYLDGGVEVWVLTKGIYPWEKFNSEKMRWFIFQKGQNWQIVNKLKEQMTKEIKEIRSPLDTL